MKELTLFVITYLVLLNKHLVVDFFLQTKEMVEYKGVYGHPIGLLHSFQHFISSLFLLGLMFHFAGISFQVAFWLSVLDFITHYHIDWGKMKIGQAMKYTVDDREFWSMIGVDQYLHSLVYVIMALVVSLS